MKAHPELSQAHKAYLMTIKRARRRILAWQIALFVAFFTIWELAVRFE